MDARRLTSGSAASSIWSSEGWAKKSTMASSAAAVMAESFGTAARYTGASLGYQLSSLLGGGFAPPIAASLLAAGAGGSGYVKLFLAVSSVATAIAVWRIQETRDVDLAAGAASAGPADRSFLERA